MLMVIVDVAFKQYNRKPHHGRYCKFVREARISRQYSLPLWSWFITVATACSLKCPAIFIDFPGSVFHTNSLLKCSIL